MNMSEHHPHANMLAISQNAGIAGNLLMLDLLANNADFKTYSKSFDTKRQFGKGHPEITNEEIADAEIVVHLLEDAERERACIHGMASCIVKIKLNINEFIYTADPCVDPCMDNTDKNEVMAIISKSFDDLVEIHRIATRDAKRDAFKARLDAFKSSIQTISALFLHS